MRTKKMTEQEQWLLKLEMERNDLSYLKPKRPELEVVKVIVKEKVYPKREEQEVRERLMFNAGRYAAGDRDKTAEAAHLWLEKSLAEEGKN